MTRPEKRRRGARKQQKMLAMGVHAPGRWQTTRHWSDATNIYQFLMSDMPLLGIIKRQEGL